MPAAPEGIEARRWLAENAGVSVEVPATWEIDEAEGLVLLGPARPAAPGAVVLLGAGADAPTAEMLGRWLGVEQFVAAGEPTPWRGTRIEGSRERGRGQAGGAAVSLEVLRIARGAEITWIVACVRDDASGAERSAAERILASVKAAPRRQAPTWGARG